MSNVDNEGLRTLDEIRARRAQRGGLDQVANQIVQGTVSAYEDSTSARADQPGGVFSWLNPGELEEIEARAGRGMTITSEEVLALVNTIGALSRRIAARFNETAQARQDAAEAREKAEEFRRSRDHVERAWSHAIREIHDLRERLRVERQQRIAELEQSVQSRDRLLEEASRKREIAPEKDT